MKAKINAISYYLPEQIVTNLDFQKENPSWNIKQIEEKSGVYSRHIASPNETALDLSYQACLKLFQGNPDLKSKVDALIFCTQSADYIMPPNSSILHKLLELPDEVFAMDYNLACSGFVYGLSLAQGLISSRQAKNVLLVTADTYSKYIHPSDRSARVLFGDGAAATWVGCSEGKDGILDILCATSGKDHDKFMIPAGGCRMPKSDQTSIVKADLSGNLRSLENIHMNGMGVLMFVKLKIPKHVEKILERNQLKLENIDQVIFHQASKMALDWLNHRFDLSPEKAFSNLSRVGNTVSASIPIALKDALDQGRISPHQKVLLVGFGVGLSYASAIVEM